MKKQTILAILLAFIILSATQAAKEDGEQPEKVQRKARSFQKDVPGNILEVEWCGTEEIYNDETDRVEVDQEIEESFDTRVFVLTDEGQVFKSNNYGKQWLHLSSKFKNSNDQPFFSTEVSVSPVDGKTVYIWGNQEISYTSEECGKTWKKLTHPKGLYDFRFHRKNKNWIIAFTDYECPKLDDDCTDSMRNLYISQDAGVTFTLSADKVLEASWNRMNNFYNIESPGVIMAIQEEKSTNVVYTEDFGKTYHTIQEGGDNFFQADYFLFLTVKPKTNKRTYEMKIATMFDDFNYYVEPKPVKLPFENKDHVSFTILKSDGAQVFLSIHHETEGFKQSNVYVSDWRGYELGLSLLYNVRNSNGDCDFEKIESNEGVYIANAYDSEKVKKFKGTQRMDIATQKNKANTQITKNINEELSKFKQSRISFDSGSKWHPIKAPAKKWNGQPYSCSGDCGLHLAGRTYEKKAQMYSSQNAPGLIVATGNVGSHLEEKFYLLNTYLSNDGGHTWLEILKGPHVFEIGDHGGIILAASAVNKTNIIKYSWDEGKTWNQHKLNVTAFEVEAIVTEPSNMEQKFIIYGKSKTSNGSSISQIASIDLESLHTRGCKGAEHPGRPDSDYEVWIPTNFSGDQCVFGRKIKYIRRKPNSECYNSITTEQKTVVEECPCTEEDWECDFGFYRKDNEGDCIPINDHYSKENLSNPPADCVWSYMISRGYRKIPGLYCSGGVELGPEMKECPPKIVTPRKEEETDEFKGYKEAQNQLISTLREQQTSYLQNKAFGGHEGETSTFMSVFTKIAYIGLVLVLLALAFVYRGVITDIIKSIGSVGQDKEKRQYQMLGKPNRKEATYKDKPTQQVRIQETEERNYDLEDQDVHYPEDDKPVLQRDQEEYYYQEEYD